MSGIQLNQENVEQLIDLMDRRDKLNSDIRNMLAGNLGTGAGTKADPKPRKREVESAMIMDIDVSGIVSKQKKKADGSYEIAGSYAKWGWAHAYTQQGEYHPKSRDLVQAIERYSSVQVGNRIYTLGGRDNKLLQFKEN